MTTSGFSVRARVAALNMLNYNHLYCFHVVATEGSFANAAERIGVTQPTVSEQVKALERALGVTLFERQSSGLRLTLEGSIAFDHTTVMFRAGENLRHALGYESSLPQALRVGVSGAIGRSTTTDFLLPLMSLKECTPTIRTGDSNELLRDVRGNDLDLAILESDPPASSKRGLEVVQLDTVTLVAVTSPNTSPAADWANLGLIIYRTSSAFRWSIDAILEERGLRPQVVAEADDALFLLEVGSREGYVSFVPRSVARDAIKAKRVKPLLSVEAVHAGVFALYQDGTGADLARRAVETLLVQLRQKSQDEPQG